ncbi:hypothetical protein CP533_0087 [Ophiocordyceps camponoti-saundersi (nom. inval.)]|nr:hypothetical protein CP533_0087 [Ophiocordyceps camponoti-saundersi (nom. inval.)]
MVRLHSEPGQNFCHLTRDRSGAARPKKPAIDEDGFYLSGQTHHFKRRLNSARHFFGSCPPLCNETTFVRHHRECLCLPIGFGAAFWPRRTDR